MPRSAKKAQERVENAAGRVLQEGELLLQGRVTHHHGAADDIGVAADILGHRMRHDVDPVVERTLHRRRREGVVHNRDDAALASDRRDGVEVGEPE
jgi:hypothetical protein